MILINKILFQILCFSIGLNPIFLYIKAFDSPDHLIYNNLRLLLFDERFVRYHNGCKTMCRIPKSFFLVYTMNNHGIN